MSNEDQSKEEKAQPVKKQESLKKHLMPKPSKIIEAEREMIFTNLETYKEKK